MNQRLRTLIVSILLLWTLCAGLFLAWKDSPTSDEGIHISSAYLALTRGELRFDPEHPFLFKYTSALPLLVIHTNLPKDDPALWQASEPLNYDSWREARSWTDEWLYQSNNNVHVIMFWTRLSAVLCLVLLGYLVYLICSWWFNEKVAIAALFFTSFNPTLLAHGHLANTDVPVAVGLLATLAALWWYAKRPSVRLASFIGIIAGITNVTKFTGIVLVFIVPLWLMYVAYQHKKYLQTLQHTALITFIAWLVIWLSYIFPLLLHPHAHTLRAPSELTQGFSGLHIGLSGAFLFHIRWLFPANFIKGLLLVLNSTEGGRPTYLLGHLYPTGTSVHSYFPILFVFKTQVVGLLLLLVGICLVVRYWKTIWQSPLAVLLTIATLTISVLSIVNRLNIGIRHIAPLFVLASIAMGWVLVSLRSKTYITVLLILYALPVFTQFNSLLGFSNILVQPYSAGYKYFSDSNLEWYEHSEDIATYILVHYPKTTVYSNYLPATLSYYGAKTHTYDDLQPPSGFPILLSASQLAGETNPIFRAIKPVDTLGNYAFVFIIPN